VLDGDTVTFERDVGKTKEAVASAVA